MEIFKLKKKLQETPYNDAIKKAVANVKSLQEKTTKLAQDAELQLQNYNKLKLKLEKAEADIASFENGVGFDAEDIDKVYKELNDQLFKTQSNISILKSNIEKITKMFEDSKAKMIETKKVYNDAKNKQEALQVNANNNCEALEKEMFEMEKGINKELLEKYKKCKADNIMPVFVFLTEDKGCGGCRQKLDIHALENLKSNKSIVCEHCRRIIIDRG